MQRIGLLSVLVDYLGKGVLTLLSIAFLHRFWDSIVQAEKRSVDSLAGQWSSGQLTDLGNLWRGYDLGCLA